MSEATKSAYIAPAVRAASLVTLRSLLSRLFTPALATGILHLARDALREESGGNYVAGSAWATVPRYRSIVLEGPRARVQAVVASWAIQGWINSATGRVTRTRDKNEILGSDVLVRTPSGQWLVTSRQWKFMPGSAP